MYITIIKKKRLDIVTEWFHMCQFHLSFNHERNV